MSPEKHIPFSKVLAALLDQDKPFPPSYLRSFSDLEIRDRVELKKIWKQIQPQRRINLLQDLEDLEEVDYTVSFEEIARLALRMRSEALRACHPPLWDPSARTCTCSDQPP